MRQTIIIEAENDTDLQTQLEKLNCSLEEYNKLSSDGWIDLLQLTVFRPDEVKSVTVESMQ